MPQGLASHVTSVPERDRRYAALREAMSGQGLDALVICARGDEFVRGRVQYVSDVFSWAGRSFVVLPAKGDAVYVGDPLAGDGYPRMTSYLEDYRIPVRAGTEVGSILGDLGLSKASVGIVGLADITAVADYDDMTAAQPNVDWQDATDLFDDVRMIKSEEEIEATKETGRILRTVFSALEAEIRPGVRERDVLAEAHRLARQLGCVEGIALMGTAPFKSFTPGTDGVIGKDDLMVFDLEWGGPSGYWVELRRVYSFKPPTDVQQKFWETRIESFAACIDAMKAGEPSQNIADARDKVYAKYGQSAEGVLAYTAHGIGVDSLEPPWVPGKDRIMEEGMMINLHPAIKFDDPNEGAALGGISIADNGVVGASGGERITDEVDEWIVLDS